MNNEIGLPLTLLRLGPEHEAAVLEMGMYVGGEIAELAAMARPSIGVVTAVQPVHLSRIGTLEAVERAKGELLEALPADGTAILNEDDPIVARMDDRSAARALRYGFAETADVRADEVTSAGVDGMRFRLRTPAGERSVAIPLPGRLSVHNALAGAAVGLAAGVSPGRDRRGPRRRLGGAAPGRARPAPGRDARRRQLQRVARFGDRGPRAARGTARSSSGGTRHDARARGGARAPGIVAVGEAAGRTVELLVVVGPEAQRHRRRGAARPAWTPARIHHVADVDAALDALRPRLRDGDVVLVKASRGIGLDGLVDALRLELGEAAR